MLSRSNLCWILTASVGFLTQAASLNAEDDVTDGPVQAPIPAQRYLLRYQFRPNDLVYYDVTQRATQTIKDGGGAVDVTKNQSTERKHYRVISVDKEGTGLLELVIDHVAMRVQFGQSEPIEFDSRSNKPAPRQFGDVQKSIGKPRARVRLTARGEMKKVVLLNNPQQGIRSRGQMAAAPATNPNDPSHNFLVTFPHETIAVGESWSNRITVQVRISKALTRPITLLRKYSLVSVEDNLATIQLSTRILTPIRDAKILTQLIQRTPKGTAVFDLDRGVIVSRTMTINKRQIGGITAKSSMHVVSHRTEQLVTAGQKTAGGTAAPTRKQRGAAAN